MTCTVTCAVTCAATCAVQATTADAEAILADMQSAGVRPAAAAYNALLACYARAARAGAAVTGADALGVVQRMEAAGATAGAATYGTWMALIRDAAARSLATRHDAAHVVARMRDSGIAPKVPRAPGRARGQPARGARHGQARPSRYRVSRCCTWGGAAPASSVRPLCPSLDPHAAFRRSPRRSSLRAHVTS